MKSPCLKWIDGQFCEYGEKCKFPHSFPVFYRTMLCTKQKCFNPRMCTYAHNEKELRKPRHNIRLTQFLNTERTKTNILIQLFPVHSDKLSEAISLL